MARPTYIYHERQLGALCGVHCVNNLLQGPRFGPGDLAEIGVRLDKKERRLLGKNGRSSGSNGSRSASPGIDGEASASPNFDGSADGGNFSIQVLSIALARAGLKLLPAEHPDGRELMVGSAAHAAGAFVVQRRGHWYALRAVGPCWWDLDSLLRRPKPLDEAALSARLGRLASGGHSIFLVIGDLPAPLPPLSGISRAATFGGSSPKQAGGTRSSVGGAPTPEVEEAEGGDSFWHEASELLSARIGAATGSTDMGYPDGAEPGSLEDGEAGNALAADCLEGFSDSEVQAALFLADNNRRRAAEVLQKARRSVESLITASPHRLAQALSAAVGAVLQARRSLPAAIARLVALLCGPSPDRLASAAALVDCGDLAHRLLTALTKKARGWLWTEGIMQAATVAVDLLLALPAASEAAAAARLIEGTSLEASCSGSDGEPAPLELTSRCPSRGSRAMPAASEEERRFVVEKLSEAPPCDSRTVDVDFSTSALDELIETIALEGLPPGKPPNSALGLKSVDNSPSTPSTPTTPVEGAQGRHRVRRRPSAHSSRLPA